MHNSELPRPERPLPPLALLRAFDAAARAGSFRAAAGLLCVTPSAISHQVKALEANLGVQLFERGGRRLALTAAGSQFFDEVATAFDLLRRACGRLREQVAGAQRLRLSANPFFTSEWLTPVLPDFSAAFPSVHLSISVTETLEDPARGESDLAVRHGSGEWPGVEAIAIAPMWAVPMHAPGKDPHRLPRIDFPYGHSSAWAIWQERGQPLSGRDGEAVHFSSFDAALRAAERGLGVAIGLLPLAAAWLRSGRLVTLATAAELPAGGLYLVHRPIPASQPGLRPMRDWLAATLSHALLASGEQDSSASE